MPQDVIWKIDPNILSGISLLDFVDLFSKYPLVTRKMLLIVPKRPNDKLEVVMNAAADKMKVEAEARNWTVIDLRGNSATKTAILDKLQNEKPDFVAYYGHSLNSCIPGQKNDSLELAITGANANVLSGRTACISACSTLSPVGVPAVNAKCVAYMAYSSLFNVVYMYNSATNTVILGAELTKDWIAGTNAVYMTLIDGMTYQDAKAAGRKKWDDLWVKWTAKRATDPKIGPFVPAGAQENRDRLDFVGQANAVARPIGLLMAN